MSLPLIDFLSLPAVCIYLIPSTLSVGETMRSQPEIFKYQTQELFSIERYADSITSRSYRVIQIDAYPSRYANAEVRIEKSVLISQFPAAD